MAQRILIGALLASLCVGGAPGQQPNTPAVASMIFAGQDGPPFPIAVQWSSTVLGLEFQGAPGSPYLMVSANNGMVLPAGISVGPAGLVDIDLSGGITAIVNGFAPVSFFVLLATIDPTGASNWTLPISQSGSLGSLQALVLDATSAAGATLTAASTVNVQVAQNLSLVVAGGGDDVYANVALAFGSTAFYDVVHTDVYVCSNGHVSFGGGDPGPWVFGSNVTAADFDTGYPRMAPLWTDLTPGLVGTGGNFVLTFVENLDGWTCRWVGMNNYSDPAAGPSAPLNPVVNNTFSVSYNYNNNVTPTNPLGFAGSIVFDYSLPETNVNPTVLGGVAADWGICGITPGGTAPAFSPIPPATSTALDPGTPLAFDPSIHPSTPPANGPGVSNGAPLASFRGVFDTTTTPFPFALLSGTGQQVVFIPGVFNPALNQANTYQIF